jgi:NAD(P)-dependent dehydrogenase (short-subunit alcohol dehydrogenase family)
MAETNCDGVALIVGAGDGTGSAITRSFAAAGLYACPARRNEDRLAGLVESITATGGRARAIALDARDEQQVMSVFAEIEQFIGPLEVVVYNAAIGARRPITELSADTFRKVWETDCLAAFLVGREAARYMQPRGRGSIFFTGATSALRGRAGFAAFAAAKHGARAVAQSMARELGPAGIHVAHVIVDGPIDGEFVRTNLPQLVAERPADGILNPDDIAANYLMLHRQPRNAWTHELDLRPWVEPW